MAVQGRISETFELGIACHARGEQKEGATAYVK